MQHDRRRRLLAAFSLAVLWTAGAAGLEAGSEPQTLKIDPQHSNVGFQVRHIFTNVSGRFRDFEGSLRFDEAHPAASSVEVTIKAPSIDTSVEARDKDLRSAKFFDVEKYPTLSFKSSAVQAHGEKKAKIKGTLTMHGVSKEVVLDAEYLGKMKDPCRDHHRPPGVRADLERGARGRCRAGGREGHHPAGRRGHPGEVAGAR
jgi:polyisoprenoid-binding protein YceI